jgi:hypothetical protein
MEQGTTRQRNNSTGEKYSTREPVLELYFLRAQKYPTKKGGGVRGYAECVKGKSEMPSAKAHSFSGSFFGALPDKMRRDAKGAEALLPRMNAEAPSERQKCEEHTSLEAASAPFPQTDELWRNERLNCKGTPPNIYGLPSMCSSPAKT